MMYSNNRLLHGKPTLDIVVSWMCTPRLGDASRTTSQNMFLLLHVSWGWGKWPWWFYVKKCSNCMFVLTLLTMLSTSLVLLCYASLHVFITGKDEFQVANVKHGCTLKSSGITNSSARFLIVLTRINCPLDQCATLLAKIAQIINIFTFLASPILASQHFHHLRFFCKSTLISSIYSHSS